MKKTRITLLTSALCLVGGMCCTQAHAILNPAHVYARFLETIKGKVTDDKGAPVPGATIRVKGSKNVVVADGQGNFTIDAKIGDILVVTAMGSNPREVTVAGSNVAISLSESSDTLNEMVVVGYGAKKKINLTGAVDQISAKQLENRPATRLSQLLQGQMAGLNITTTTSGGAPNATQNINVRGFTGLGVSGGPLVVIDGVQGGDINTLNPSDIESVSMLKDAASAAIYGSSAPYGVLLVTTKKGKEGKPIINYNNNFGFAQPINLPEMMNSLDFANIYNEAYANAGRGAAFTDEVMQRIRDFQAGVITNETQQMVTNGTKMDNWDTYFTSQANNDWFKIYFKDYSFAQQQNLSVSGAGNKTDYYVGLGYNQKNGMYRYGDDRYTRYNVRATINSEVSKWLGFSLRASLAKGNNNTPNTYGNRTGGNYLHQIARKFPTVPLNNPNGEYAESNDIPLHEYGGRATEDRNDVLTTGELRITPLPGWKIVANYTFDGIFQNNSNHVKTVFSTLPSGTQAAISGTSPNSYSLSNANTAHHIVNAFSSYDKSFGKHNFGLMAGFVRELTTYKSFSGSNTNLYSDDLPSLSLTYGSNATTGDGVRELAVQGVFGRFTYNYADKYMLELNGRYDGTSRFLSDVRWKFYPGVSAGWNVDKEAFWNPIAKVVNTFKIRGNYGSQADQQFLDVNGVANWYPFYPSLGTVRPTSTTWFFGTSREASVGLPPLVNPNLTWVTTTSYGIGFDLTFLRNRLSTTFDLYKREAKDFAGPSAPLPSTLGATVPTSNNASIETKGFELSVKWNDHIGELNYGIRATLADYTGTVKSYPNPTNLLTDWYAGQKMGTIWGYESNGLYTDATAQAALPTPAIWTGAWRAGDVKYEDLNGDGKITTGTNTLTDPGDRKIIGNNTPRYQYGFTLDLSWKNFDFSTFVQGVAKRDAWIGSNFFWGMQSSEWQSSPFTVHADRWSASNPNGYFPRYYVSNEVNKNFQTSTRYLQNAAYMRWKNLQVGYTLPALIASKAGLKKVRLYVSVENLATATDLIKTMDPELSIGDAKIYPLQRTYSFGINLSL